MVYVTLTLDHRVLDAQQSNAFMVACVSALESPVSAGSK
jgi:pyruvate/2-oxoglutarate dehydrogenase complex dihydrolipoamide acyltransferase (E2) component